MLQSKEEYEASVCLCGSQVCRGSYLNLTGEGAFQKVQALLSCFCSCSFPVDKRTKKTKQN